MTDVVAEKMSLGCVFEGWQADWVGIWLNK